MPTLRWLIVLFVVITCASCWSTKRGGGTNLPPGTGSDGNPPWTIGGGGGNTPALTGDR
jgi:hypothetical protein